MKYEQYSPEIRVSVTYGIEGEEEIARNGGGKFARTRVPTCSKLKNKKYITIEIYIAIIYYIIHYSERKSKLKHFVSHLNHF